MPTYKFLYHVCEIYEDTIVADTEDAAWAIITNDMKYQEFVDAYSDITECRKVSD